MYISYYILMYKVKRQTYNNFFSQPAEQQVLNYTEYEIEDAKHYGYDLPPLNPTMSNILYYWEDGNGMYNGLKLLLVIPVTIHLAYIISNYWWTAFKVHASFCRTKLPNNASHALILLKKKTGMTNDLQTLTFLKIHHYFYNNQHFKEITFENEKYYISLENNVPKLTKKFAENKSKIPEVHNESDGLTNKEHYIQLQNYGENRIYLQYPKYSKILGDELLSPYFAFQVFTSILYALDNFMTYALFQFSFLFLNEGATMFSKYNSLKQVCKLAPRPVKVNVLRDGKEEIVSSSTLVPGDVVLLKADDYNNLDDENEDAEEEEVKEYLPNEQILQLPMFRLLFRLKEIIFGKYQDPSVWQDLDKLERSPILPADFILLDGQIITDESILTGEQTSQIKEAAEKLQDDYIQPFNYLYAGTKLVQVQSGIAKVLVTKTALQTEQGGLIKTIAFNEDRMNITTKDSIVFLGILCVVALFSSGYIFKRGYENSVCALNKLCLETLMIFVSVIPPDLPTELAMCIGNSIKDMRQKKIFSSDPYKILNAGRVKYVCFDKSGTLTQSGIKIIGVDDQISQINQYQIMADKQESKQSQLITYINQLKTQKYSGYAKLVLAGCQSLSQVKDKVLGDVLEVSQFAFISGKFNSRNSVNFDDNQVQILHRFFFNSNLKRMSVIAKHKGSHYILTKGSPEAVRNLLESVPTDYDIAVDNYNLLGYRVLSLAWRQLNNDEVNQIQENQGKNLDREELEANLKFCGLLICETPLKPDTQESISILRGSGHQIKVISGDHVINLAVCCRNCGIFDKKDIPTIISSLETSGATINKVRWISINKPEEEKEETLDEFLNQHKAICVTNSNDVLQFLLQTHSASTKKLFNQITGFGRTTPQQKQQIVDRYQNQASESRVMFVGDGVNDLNALQAADIGVALVENSADEETDKQKKKKKKEVQVQIPYPSVMGPNNTPASYLQLLQVAQERAQRNHTNYQIELRTLMMEQMRYKQYLKIQRTKNMQANNDIFGMWNDAFEAEAERDAPELGDATIAAAFTVKGVPSDDQGSNKNDPIASNLSGVLTIIRQGRCALSSVQMNFKTTALRCLTAAYQLTALTLNGVRSSDSQMIFGAILSIFVMLYINKCKQQKIISKKRPPRAIVGWYLITSMFLQALVHVAAVYLAQWLADAPQVTMKLNTKFSPSLVNTAVFYVTMVQEVVIVLVNYPGKPHMQSIREHKKLCFAIIAYCISVFVLVTEQMPEINEKLGLVSLSHEMQMQVLALCFADGALAFLFEKLAVLLFG